MAIKLATGSVSIFNREGQRVFHHPKSEWIRTGFEAKDFPFLKEALRGKVIVTRDITDRKGKEWIVAATPIQSIGWVAGAGRIKKEALAPITSSLIRHGIIFLLVTIASLLLAWLLARNISLPLRRLNRQAQMLGEGNLHQSVPLNGPEELRELGQSFNRMAQQLSEQREALRKANEELEIRVEERTSRLHQSNQALEESERNLRHLSTQLLRAQEEERKRLARELHDSIGATLSAVKFRVEGTLIQTSQADPSQVTKSLKELVPIIQYAIEDARRIYMNLRPSILDDLGIIATLNWYVKEFKKSHPEMKLKGKILVQEEEIPEPLKVVIFRIIQEATNNSAKYSGADQVIMTLAKEEDSRIQLTIEDNGQGFNIAEVESRKNPQRGLGLVSMRERAELSGGHLFILSGKGKGAKVRAIWPV